MSMSLRLTVGRPICLEVTRFFTSLELVYASDYNSASDHVLESNSAYRC
uniref:Uncharacterized protein n=1 Tax=Rhizophora mucronata TaxID=61149 RepID=A0A2P2PWA2_RHIMU